MWILNQVQNDKKKGGLFYLNTADSIDDLQVRTFITSTDVVDICFFTGMVDKIDPFAVVKYIEPVTDVFTVTVDRG